MNYELKKNAEGYTDPTAAATLSKKEPGDIWTYMSQECLIIKNHGGFSTCLLLGKERRNTFDVEIQTSIGLRYTDPRKLTWGAHNKMYEYLGPCGLIDYGAAMTAVDDALGIKLPDKKEPDWQKAAMQSLTEIETEVAALQAERNELRKQNEILKDRVNKVTLAKMKVVNQLELLQGMVGSVLARFQVDTEE